MNKRTKNPVIAKITGFFVLYRLLAALHQVPVEQSYLKHHHCSHNDLSYVQYVPAHYTLI